jgi:death-on-curing protein
MIEEENWRYLDREDIRSIHAALSSWAEQQGEPVPPFAHASHHDVDALVNTPRQKLFGRDAYPTVAEKAAIIFYTVNKKQIFLNGNKRMSTLCLLVFLDLNDKELDVLPDELTKKALWLANTSSLEFPAIKSELVEWIAAHLKDGSESIHSKKAA